MSSCLSGSGRSYGFDLDIVKPSSSTATSSSSRSFHSSSPSSTLSESSNSPPRTISIKKARAPRKRPNQMYDEAAALLSTIYPNIFSAKSLCTKPLSKKAVGGFDSFQDTPELLPPLPVLSDAAFLIRPPPPPGQPAFRIKLKAASPFDASSPSNELSMDSPCSPVLLLDDVDDIDAESILDEEVGEGIDSIMGNVAASSSGLDSNDDEESSGRRVRINPYLRSLIGSRTGGRYDFGSRLRHDKSMQQALRRRDEGEWWRTPAVPVPMGEILPQFKQPPLPASSSSAKKSKNKNKKKTEKNKPEDAATTNAATAPEEKSKGGLGLKLSHDDVLKAWSGRSMFSDGPDSPESAAVAMAGLKDIDLSPDGGGVGAVREASVLRYKEKRRSRLFSKKIRYEVRKANADRRPRMQGRFVSSPSLLQQAMEAECSQ